jgi:hypothetical protein
MTRIRYDLWCRAGDLFDTTTEPSRGSRLYPRVDAGECETSLQIGSTTIMLP